MILIALTDIHAHTNAIRKLAFQLQSADLVLLCGDITHFGHKREIAHILQLVRTHNPAIYAVTGNCDYPDTEKYLSEENLSLNAITREYQGYTFAGLSGSLPCPGKTPHEYTEEEYKAILGGINVPAGKPLLMVSHQPPYGTVNDEVTPGLHVGSKAVRSFIEKHQPLICFTGHIHEGIGIGHIGNTAVVNPGPAGTGGYVYAEITDGKIKKLDLAQPFRK
jgi:hypothetical protein